MNSKPLWISHRGLCLGHDENTRDAFDLAIKNGFTHLETDLRATTDGHIVLCHDRSLARIAGDPRYVDQLPRSVLESIVARQGGHLMFLDEFIERYAAYHWTFDIKPETGALVVSTLLRWIEEHSAKSWFEAQARFLFWHADHEKQLCSALPQAKCYATKWECWQAGLAVIAGLTAFGNIRPGRVYAIPPRLLGRDLFCSQYVKRFQNYGAKTIAFLPANREHARAAIIAGFDEILTNHEIVRLGARTSETR